MTRIRVVHRAGYDYDPWAMASHNEARMTPRSTPTQLVLNHKLEITPTAWQHAYTDYWGTSVLSFEIHEKHHRLIIVATTELDVTRSSIPVAPYPPLEWDDLGRLDVADGLCEYLDSTPDTDVAGTMDGDLQALRDTSATPAEFVGRVCDLVSTRVRPRARPFGVQWHAIDAWKDGAGSARDVTHLMLGALRSHGIPARYVSGYRLPQDDPEIGAALPGEAAAWLEFWDGHWQALDPTSGKAPGDFHVEVAHGRDFHDVNPLSGIFTGVRTADTFVEVRLTRLN